MTFSSPTTLTISSIILKIFSAVLHISNASIDFKKTVPLGLFTKKLSIVLLFLSVHPSVIIVHPTFFQQVYVLLQSTLSSQPLASNISLLFHDMMVAF